MTVTMTAEAQRRNGDSRVRRLFAGALGLLLLVAGAILTPARAAEVRLSAIRHGSQEGATRVVVELSGEAEWKQFRLENPPRVNAGGEPSEMVLDKAVFARVQGEQLLKGGQVCRGEAFGLEVEAPCLVL